MAFPLCSQGIPENTAWWFKCATLVLALTLSGQKAGAKNQTFGEPDIYPLLPKLLGFGGWVSWARNTLPMRLFRMWQVIITILELAILSPHSSTWYLWSKFWERSKLIKICNKYWGLIFFFFMYFFTLCLLLCGKDKIKHAIDPLPSLPASSYNLGLCLQQGPGHWCLHCIQIISSLSFLVCHRGWRSCYSSS